MDSRIKNILRRVYEAPEPKDKRRFLMEMSMPPISYGRFVYEQIFYIRKWVWVLSAFIFVFALFGAGHMKNDMVWCMSALMPMLALTFITECCRSEVYGMTEFELASRFSLKSVVLARLGILGLANFVLICMAASVVFVDGSISVLRTAVYLFCPYLLTAFLGLWAVRKTHGKQSIYACLCIAVGISAMYMLLHQNVPMLYAKSKSAKWVVVLLVSGAGAFREYQKRLKIMEELM